MRAGGPGRALAGSASTPCGRPLAPPALVRPAPAATQCLWAGWCGGPKGLPRYSAPTARPPAPPTATPGPAESPRGPHRLCCSRPTGRAGSRAASGSSAGRGALCPRAPSRAACRPRGGPLPIAREDAAEDTAPDGVCELLSGGFAPRAQAVPPPTRPSDEEPAPRARGARTSREEAFLPAAERRRRVDAGARPPHLRPPPDLSEPRRAARTSLDAEPAPHPRGPEAARLPARPPGPQVADVPD